ncbi:DUF1152 domain-containing protein [Actinomadura yumaensis]|uniref:DUF1152 domain-containing protein n=1 Tax=Actinomadura yumaensis TaxID=111807 RepID=UPI0036104146
METLDADAVVLVDGGTDILLRGDEAGLGTPEEDMASLAAVRGLDVPEKIVVSLGFGVDSYRRAAASQHRERLDRRRAARGVRRRPLHGPDRGQRAVRQPADGRLLRRRPRRPRPALALPGPHRGHAARPAGRIGRREVPRGVRRGGRAASAGSAVSALSGRAFPSAG